MKVLRTIGMNPPNDLFERLTSVGKNCRLDYVECGSLSATKREIQVYKDDKLIHTLGLGTQLENATYLDLVLFAYLDHFYTAPWQLTNIKDTISRTLEDPYNYLTGKQLDELVVSNRYQYERFVEARLYGKPVVVKHVRVFHRDWMQSTWEIPMDMESRNLPGVFKRNVSVTVTADFDGTVQPVRDLDYLIANDEDLMSVLDVSYRDPNLDRDE